MKKKEDFFSKFMGEMKKTRKQDQYKVYERYAKKALGHDLSDPNDDGYWKLIGEAIEYYGNVEIFESRESLKGKMEHPHRDAILNVVLADLSDNERMKLLKKYPRKCPKCGFHRFFGVRIEFFSTGKTLDFFCPNCDLHFEVVGSEGW